MNRIDKIITEEINRFILGEGVLDDLKSIFRDYTKKKGDKKSSSENDGESKEKKREKRKKDKEREKKNKHSKRLRKTVNGGKTYYDYDDYERKNRKTSKTDADSIRNAVDQENTDIRALADDIFPNHTKNGAQSQLRKILNGERPMTKTVASKLNKSISSGKAAIK